MTKEINFASCLRCYVFKWFIQEPGKNNLLCEKCSTTLSYMHKKVEDKRKAVEEDAKRAKREYYANKKEAKRRLKESLH